MVKTRVDRVLSFLSSRPNWDSPTPTHAGERVPTPSGFGGEGVRRPNSNEGTDTVVLQVFMYFVVETVQVEIKKIDYEIYCTMKFTIFTIFTVLTKQ